MFLAKGYFRVGRILSIFWITLLSTLALSILFFSPSANASSLDNFIAANSVDKLEFCGIDISNRLFTVVFNNLDGSLSNEIVYDPGYHTISSDQSYIDIFKESMKSEDGSWAFVKNKLPTTLRSGYSLLQNNCKLFCPSSLLPWFSM